MGSIRTESEFAALLADSGKRNLERGILDDLITTFFNTGDNVTVADSTAVGKTFDTADANTRIPVSATAQTDWYIPLFSKRPIPVGSKIEIVITGTSFVRILGAVGVTVYPKPGFSTASLTGSGARVQMEHVVEDIWILGGDLSRIPLKGFANIHTAIGMRKLVDGYAGPSMLLRETSAGNVDLDIYFDANGNFDNARAYEHQSTNALAVGTGYDQSGNSRDFAQTTDANQPALTLNSANGHPTIDFTAASSHYLFRATSSDASYDSAAHTLNWAASVPGSQNDLRIYAEGSSSTNTPSYTFGTGKTADFQEVEVFIRDDASATLQSDALVVTANDGVHRSVAITDNSGALTAYVDGAAEATDSYIRGTLTLDRAALGCFLRTTASSFVTMDLAEFITFSAIPTAAEIQALQRNQNAYLGV